jgi:REP element-mobilizing transposase RayT
MTAESSPERLRRLELLFVRTPIYFVTACTSRRRKILSTSAVHQSFIKFARDGPQHSAWIGAYVLMPDHLHLFVAVDDEKITLTDWMKSLKNVLSRRLRSTGILPPHFQKGFFDHVLRSAESYGEKWHYVRENPVRAGLVRRWEDWPFRGEIFALEYRAEQ